MHLPAKQTCPVNQGTEGSSPFLSALIYLLGISLGFLALAVVIYAIVSAMSGRYASSVPEGEVMSEDQNTPKEFELYRDNDGEFRWRLRARNGRVIASSGEGYKNKADAEHAIGLVKNASAATVV